ncbi:hypothetical protein G5V57_15615 [Nordella sp. HKS 07]|uniref:ferric reductase-like transmembrane domain-containing protein n=1 Tax=Nordella sp. HKS 07 TaxID=2712222 RepID=UPI0013E1D660|nr:ferric reductase-like transmembrane domain-containing protein [Nordella sp. HKS 07]QIG49021.1 hypothetical protein G5V57_15615 [Nordella sp. HKS 07]
MHLGFLLRSAPWRHILAIVLAALLVYLFGAVHGQWSPMHRWNRATADASLLLLTLTMAIGPAARLLTRLRLLVPLRREFGIYAVLLALIHTLIIFDGWLEWDLARLVGLAFHPDLARYVMIEHGFGLANIIGLAALLYGLVLAMTSADRAVRFLGAATWKFVQSAAYVLWALVLAHTAYFLFIHFLHFHRQTPDANPLQIWFAGLVVLVLVLRIAASILTWRRRQGSPGPGETRMSPVG